LLICGTMLHFNPGMDEGKKQHEMGIKFSDYLLHFNQTSEEKLKEIYPSPSIIRPLVYQLENYNLSVYKH